MPNVFVDSLEVAEADADPSKAVAPPHGAGRDGRLPHRQGPAAVQQHGDGPLHVHTQQLLQCVVVPVLAGEEPFSGTWRVGTQRNTCRCGEPTSLVPPTEMMKSKNGSSPAW